MDVDNQVVFNLRAHMFGLGAHLFDQPGALDGVGKAGIILDIGGDCELTARLDAGDHERFEHGAGGIDGGGIAGRARADDYSLGVHCVVPINLRWKQIWHGTPRLQAHVPLGRGKPGMLRRNCINGRANLQPGPPGRIK